MKTKQHIAAAAVAVLILPVSVAFAASTPPSQAGAFAAARTETPAAVAARHAVGLRHAHVVHQHAVRRTVRLARSRARLMGRPRPHTATYAGWSTPRLADHSRRLRRSLRDLRLTGGAPAIAIPAALTAIARCESGGNPQAVDASGTYRGLFQFDSGTWASVGGHGDPAAAPAREQYRRAAMLYARSGAAPWPVCGR